MLMSAFETIGFLIYIFIQISEKTDFGGSYCIIMLTLVIQNSLFLLILVVLIIIPVILVSLFVIALLLFHVYLMSIGKSTKEYIKIKNETTSIKISIINSDNLNAGLQNLNIGDNILVEDWGDQAPAESKKPYLVFSMPLTNLEAEYLSRFEMCL
jgi:hypothetical protein